MKTKKYLFGLLGMAICTVCFGKGSDFFIKPVIGVGMGYGFAQDNAVTQIKLDTYPVLEVDTKGAGAHGFIYQGFTGLDMKYQSYYAGLRLGYQQSNIVQSMIIKIPSTGAELKINGGLYHSFLLSGRLGCFLSDNVTLYLEGGYTWSTAGSDSYDGGTKISSATLKQHGPLLGLGTMLNLTDHLILDFGVNYVDYCGTNLPMPIVAIAKTSVESLNLSALLSLGYRF